MKCLFYRYGSICEPDILQGWRELGIDVYEISDEIEDKTITAEQGVKRVSEWLLQQPVDFVFSINFYPFLSEVCNIFHIRYFCWTVDSPLLELFSASISNPWNRVFLFDKMQLAEISPLNPGCVFHLPLAANVENKKRLFENTAPAQHQKFAHDIAFVGSLYTEKCPYDKLSDPPDYLAGYLEGIMDAQKKIYGYYFISELLTDEITEDFKAHYPDFYEAANAPALTDKEILSQFYIGNKITALERMDTMRILSSRFPVDIYTGSDTSQFANIRNHGFAKTLTEMPLIFHNSKINLNTTSKAIRSSLPLRLFDIVSCGGFVLTNYQCELEELFTPGKDMAVYTSLEEAADLCAYYLQHASQRRELAQAGYETLCKYHTYSIRLEQMLRLGFA